MGRAYYIVCFPYDKNYELFALGYAAEVIIWADTGVAYSIMFGNYGGFFNIDKPYVYNDSTKVVPYDWYPPLKHE